MLWFICVADFKSHVSLKSQDHYDDLISHIKDNQNIVEWVYNIIING